MLVPSSADPLQNLPLSVVTLRKTYRDRAVSPWHAHPRLQLMYATSGLMMAETETARWAVPEGHGLIIPAETPHQSHMIGEVHLKSLYVTEDTLGGFAACRIVSISPLLAALIDRLCGLENPGPETQLSHHLSALVLLELAQAPASPLALPFPEHAGLREVCAALVSDPAHRGSIDHWSQIIGMSRRSFTRSFVKQTGLSFGDWRQRLRCQVALQAFAQGERAEKIAAKVGYSSPYAMKAMMDKLL